MQAHTNEFGNVDVATACGAGENGKTFITNMDEISRVRAGEDMYEFMLWRKPFNFGQTALSFVVPVVLINIIGAALIGLYRVVRWIVLG